MLYDALDHFDKRSAKVLPWLFWTQCWEIWNSLLAASVLTNLVTNQLGAEKCMIYRQMRT
jgi:hypothetical protein